MAQSPLTSNSDLVSISIKSNGDPIPDTYQVLSIFVDRTVNTIPHCALEIQEGEDDFSMADSDTFVPGNLIEVQAGYNNKNTTIFKGIILRQTVSTGDNGPVLRILCKDETVKITIGPKNVSFKGMKDSDIISKLISNNGLSADVTSTTTQMKEVIQYNATDWDFIVSRAEANGMVVYAQDGKVSVKKPGDATEVALLLTYGDDIYEFNAEIDTEEYLKSSKAGSWPKVTTSLSKYTNATGSVKFQGSALALPGKLINIVGVGKRFSGKRFVAGITHLISEGNWVTTAQIGLSPEEAVGQANLQMHYTSGLLPGIHGLQVGKVKQINNDPAGDFRVLVKLPLIQDGIWARLATFYATANAGAFFYPEVDDEVAVGFFNDDPAHPVILGAMYSKDRAGAYTPDEQNSNKAFVSREQMKIAFDEEKKIITITTPANNQLVFSDDAKSITLADQNNNNIKMSPDGIELNSASNIRMNATQKINIHSQDDTTVESDSNLSLAGLNVNCQADVELSAVGNASAAFSSSGELIINGALVMIN